MNCIFTANHITALCKRMESELKKMDISIMYEEEVGEDLSASDKTFLKTE